MTQQGAFPNVLDTSDFVRRAWSQMNLPSSLVPTTDLGEIDQRITDLKAIEQWLNMNVGMLRGTIQALEVQRNTLAAISAFGAAIGTTMAPLTEGISAPSPAPASPGATRSTARKDKEEAAAAPVLPGLIDATVWWTALQQQFNQIASDAMAAVASQAAATSTGSTEQSAPAPSEAGARHGESRTGAARSSAPAPGAPRAASPDAPSARTPGRRTSPPR